MYALLVQDVHYIVKNQANKREKLSILSGVSGYFNPGEMAAVMGPSGSGAALYLLPSRTLNVGLSGVCVFHE